VPRGLDTDIVRMANQIAAQFRHLPEPAAAEALAGHLRTFWDPRMRAALGRHLADGGAGLDPEVRAAATLLGG
jgi:formate dehydrogenase subunit delta